MRNVYRSAPLFTALAITLTLGASAAQAKDLSCLECWLGGKSSLTQDKSSDAPKQKQEHQQAAAMQEKVAVAATAKNVGPDNGDQGDGPLKALGADDNHGQPPANDLPKAAEAAGDGNDNPADDQVAQVVDDKGKGKPKKSHGAGETEGRSDHRGGNGGGSNGGGSGGGNGGGHNADGSPK